MKLFTVGPVEMRKEILEVGGQQVPYFRTKEFSDLMMDSDVLLRKFMHAPKGAKSVYLTASGTAAMEATIMNCLTSKDRVLIVDGGTFGHRFVQICEIHGISYERIVLKPDEKLTEKHFAPFDDKEITALLVNVDETSTGQLYNIKICHNFCKRNHAYLVVDAISSYLIDAYNMEENDIDATIISSQKGLCIAPGLSIIVLSERIIEDRVNKINPQNLYFNFKDYLRNFTRGQTPYTPCVGICVEMNKALHMVDEEGLEVFLGRIRDIAQDFRVKAQELPARIPEYPLSNAVTPLIFHEPIGKKIFEILKNDYDVFVNPTGGKTEPYVIRVAHIGDVTKEDNDTLIGLIKKAIEKIYGER